MRCGVHVVTKMQHCGGSPCAYWRVMVDFSFPHILYACKKGPSQAKTYYNVQLQRAGRARILLQRAGRARIRDRAHSTKKGTKRSDCLFCRPYLSSSISLSWATTKSEITTTQGRASPGDGSMGTTDPNYGGVGIGPGARRGFARKLLNKR